MAWGVAGRGDEADPWCDLKFAIYEPEGGAREVEPVGNGVLGLPSRFNLRPLDIGRNADEDPVVPTVIEVQMAVHYGSNIRHIYAVNGQRFINRMKLWAIGLLDEGVSRANAGVDGNRTVWVLDQIPVYAAPLTGEWVEVREPIDLG